MKRLREKLQKLNNRGLTLVELICAVAILSLIGTTIGGILVVSARSYDTGINEVDLQQEAQMIVNQISDLVIDTTPSSPVTFSGSTLSIPQGDGTHEVEYDSASGSLYYSYASTTETISDELMATGITVFSVDTSSFTDSGNLYVDLGLKRESQNGPRTFEATFQITSRNGIVDTTPSASIDVVDDIVLEPNQNYEFTPVVVGISNQTVTWSIAGGNTDSNTYMVGNKICIGKDEKGSIIHLLVQTAEVDADGNPMAVRAVRVRIRRVNTITVKKISVVGDALKSGTEYTFAADLTGTYLDKEPWAWDDDYVDPYGVSWSATSTGSVATANPDIIDLAPDPYNPSRVMVTVKLKEDMPRNSQITIRATAKHPMGTYGGTATNKTGFYYDDVFGEFILDNSQYIVPTHGLGRGSDDEFAHYYYSDLSSYLVSLFGNDTYNTMRMYRYRETGTGDAGWSRWYTDKDDYGFDGDNSESINVRPKFGLMLRYGKEYDVQIKVNVVKASTGEVVWPFVDTPVDQYLLEGKLDKVQISFSSSGTALGFDNQLGLPAESGKVINKQFNDVLIYAKDVYSLGGNTNREDFKNDVMYTLQRKEGADWVTVETQKGKEYRPNLNNTAGEYRVLIWMYERHVFEDGTTFTNDTDPRRENYKYEIWQNGGGEGIFYFRAE